MANTKLCYLVTEIQEYKKPAYSSRTTLLDHESKLQAMNRKCDAILLALLATLLVPPSQGLKWVGAHGVADPTLFNLRGL